MWAPELPACYPRRSETVLIRRNEPMAPPTPDEARRFIIERIVAEAEREGFPLSSNERRMLNWSEVEPDCIAEPELAEALAREISDQDYEAKVSRLVAAAYDQEVSAVATARESYRAAYSVLKRGDYYLMVMIDEALRAKLRRWWDFWR
jgi:hypothetical protein